MKMLAMIPVLVCLVWNSTFAKPIIGRSCKSYGVELEALEWKSLDERIMGNWARANAFSLLIGSLTVVDNTEILSRMQADVSGLSAYRSEGSEMAVQTADSKKLCMRFVIDLDATRLDTLARYVAERLPEIERAIKSEKMISAPDDGPNYRVLKAESKGCEVEFEIEDGVVTSESCYEWRIHCTRNVTIARPVWSYTFRDNDGVPLGHSTTTIQKFGLPKYIGTFRPVERSNLAWRDRMVVCKEGEIRRVLIPVPTTRYDVDVKK